MTGPAPKVSVIVPIYNVGDCMERCIATLRQQTLQDIEIILIDDGSTDESGAIAREAAAATPTFRYVRKENGGVADARNVGLDLARGDYIGFVDADDWVSPRMFERLLAVAEETDSDVVVCQALRHHEERNLITPVDFRAPLKNFGHSVAEAPWVLIAGHAYLWNKLFRRDLIDRANARFPQGRGGYDDVAFVYPLLGTANRVTACPEALYHYRFGRAGSVTHRFRAETAYVLRAVEDVVAAYREPMARDKRLARVVEKIAYNSLIDFRFDVAMASSKPLLVAPYLRRAHAFLDATFPGWRNRQCLAWSRDLAHHARTSWTLSLAMLLMPRTLYSSARRRFTDLRNRIEAKATTPGPTAAVGTAAIRTLCAVLHQRGAIHFADFGTLRMVLGRQAAGSAADVFEFGVVADDEENKYAILEALEEAGFRRHRTGEFQGTLAESWLSYEHDMQETLVCLRYYAPTADGVRMHLLYCDPDISYSAYGLSVAELHYSSFDVTRTVACSGTPVPVPDQVDRVLEEKYGEGLRGWTYWKSPAARRLSALGTVRIG